MVKLNLLPVLPIFGVVILINSVDNKGSARDRKGIGAFFYSLETFQAKKFRLVFTSFLKAKQKHIFFAIWSVSNS